MNHCDASHGHCQPLAQRKAGVVTVAATLGSDGFDEQMYFGVWVLAVALGLQLLAQPYRDKGQGRVENLALSVEVVSLYLGLRVAAPGLGETVTHVFESTIMLLNVALLAYCLASVGVNWLRNRRATALEHHNVKTSKGGRDAANGRGDDLASASVSGGVAAASSNGGAAAAGYDAEDAALTMWKSNPMHQARVNASASSTGASAAPHRPSRLGVANGVAGYGARGELATA